ncbi:molybdenum cofactor biosynthesis protein MoaE [Heyndrickxia acidiproducens]|uniref:molybdenum cofactor biosynthesis protein MoaE n=1 Tax=Heyndrickxia acidiproducens TaxID=1121084 RepID=UPI00035EAFC4|nr:molybdenum cofactor biosynthesis protein MoaE [Heyndrickxia acidiproducens]
MFAIVKEPIDVAAVIQATAGRNAGAIVTFIGTVRELTNGKKTIYLEYEAYEAMAQKKLEQIGGEIKRQFSEAKTAIVHRIGRLEISDVAVAIAVSAPHRDDAYRANRYAIERIKEMVPIWKKEHWDDGEEWIGSQHGTVSYEKTGFPKEGGR